MRVALLWLALTGCNGVPITLNPPPTVCVDTARLDWMEQEMPFFFRPDVSGADGWQVYDPAKGFWSARTLRDAIDSARAMP